MHQKNQKAIVSAVCWVNRGYARATLEEYNPTEEELKHNKNLAKKLLKGQDPNTMEIGEAKKQIEENLNQIDDDMDDSDEDTNVPIFTSELGKLKDKYEGIDKKKGEDDNDDEDAEGMVVDDD